jgi:hypothetical protein
MMSRLKRDKNLGIYLSNVQQETFFPVLFLVMHRSVLRLHALCCIGPHFIAAFISLSYDIKSWYDTISAVSIVLTTIVGLYNNEICFRGSVHNACILFGVVRYT